MVAAAWHGGTTMSGAPPEQYLLFRQRSVRVSGWLLLAERHQEGARYRLWLGRNELGSATLHASCTRAATAATRDDWGWWCRVDDDARRRLAVFGLALAAEPCERTDRPTPSCHARVAYGPLAGAAADATALRLPAHRCLSLIHI